jgi:hypothetical protein
MYKRTASFVAIISLIGILGVAWFERDNLFDSWRLRNYSAPVEVVKLADATTMDDKARRLFYVYRPSLDDKTTFNQHCSGSEQTIVLGCYVEHDGIYLYTVPDERLNGVIEVTAAHELLHAAYDRLSSKEKSRVDALTAQVAANITDERLKKTIENYRSKDASVVPNELHSILGTELRSLPPELEAYYKQYFTNRAAIVDFADRYKQAFTERENEVEALDNKLKAAKAEIEVLNASLESQQAQLKSQYDILQQTKRNGDVDAYNNAVAGYNQQVNRYNADVNKQKRLVSNYNATVEQRNNLAVEENELIKALDSRDTVQSQ